MTLPGPSRLWGRKPNSLLDYSGSDADTFPPTLLITVLMPCLNEADTLAECIQQAHTACQSALARRTGPPCATEQAIDKEGLELEGAYEIVIADNGSTDQSREIALANNARVVRIEKKGYGAALLGGIAAAHGRYVIMADSDGSYDFGEVPRFLEILESGYDLVLGNRFAGGILPGAMPWHHRYIGNPVLSGLGQLLYHTPCRDWHCGLRGFDRTKIQALHLKANGMEFASEMIIASSKAKLRMREIPIRLHPDRRLGPPHLRSVRDGLRHLCVLLRHSNTVRFACLGILLIFGTFLMSQGSNNAKVNRSQSVLVDRGGRIVYQLICGEVTAGESLDETLDIINHSTEELSTPDRIYGCSCLSYSFEPPSIPPGGRGLARVSFTAPEVIGNFSTTATGRISPKHLFMIDANGIAVSPITTKQTSSDPIIDFGEENVWTGPLSAIDANWTVDFAACDLPSSITQSEISKGKDGRMILSLKKSGAETSIDGAKGHLAFIHQETGRKLGMRVLFFETKPVRLEPSAVRTSAKVAAVKIATHPSFFVSDLTATQITGDPVSVRIPDIAGVDREHLEIELQPVDSAATGMIMLRLSLRERSTASGALPVNKSIDMHLPFVFLKN